jgi:hypothetical protein
MRTLTARLLFVGQAMAVPLRKERPSATRSGWIPRRFGCAAIRVPCGRRRRAS